MRQLLKEASERVGCCHLSEWAAAMPQRSSALECSRLRDFAKVAPLRCTQPSCLLNVYQELPQKLHLYRRTNVGGRG